MNSNVEELDHIFDAAPELSRSLGTENKNPIPKREIDPVDRMLEWLEELPAKNLQSVVQLGDAVMEFDQTNLRNLSGFGYFADDRGSGEIILCHTELDDLLPGYPTKYPRQG